VNNLTESNAEFLLVNGMPRISREDMKSVGKVETISGAYTKLKEKYGLEVVDTMSVFNKLGVEDMKAYYNDTIHPKQEGHKFISKFIAEKLQ
jgi:lysophospholipase L1-like esterase